MPKSHVLEHPAEEPAAALAHFRSKLSLEADSADVWADIQSGAPGIVVVDGRSAEAYARGHVPGAISLPYRLIDAAATAGLPRDAVFVTYCDGVGCNASTKTALRLAALGFKVKEMPGGLDWWRRDGHPVEAGGAPVSTEAPVKCGC